MKPYVCAANNWAYHTDEIVNHSHVITTFMPHRWIGKSSVYTRTKEIGSLLWRHNHQPYDCFLNRLFGRRSKETAKLCVTSLCVRNSPVTGEFPTQMASNAENVSIWWRHRGKSSVWHGNSDCVIRVSYNSSVWATNYIYVTRMSNFSVWHICPWWVCHTNVLSSDAHTCMM